MKGKENMVCRLKKNLHRLKQALRQWYKKFNSFMVGHRYIKTNVDHYVYVKKFPDGKFLFFCYM